MIDKQTKIKTSRIIINNRTKIRDDIQNNMLKCCKFCGSEKRRFYYQGLIKRCFVQCDDCGYKTNNYYTEYEAMQEFNLDKYEIILTHNFIKNFFRGN